MKITAPLLAAGVVALAGCAAPHKDMGMMSRATCTTSPCRLTVKVTGTDCQRVTIKTTPQILDVKVRDDIEWTLDGPTNWTFTNKGVEFKWGGGGGFSGAGAGGGTTYRWHNNNSVKGDHRYNVNVTPDRGRTSCTEDPTIVNH